MLVDGQGPYARLELLPAATALLHVLAVIVTVAQRHDKVDLVLRQAFDPNMPAHIAVASTAVHCASRHTQLGHERLVQANPAAGIGLASVTTRALYILHVVYVCGWKRLLRRYGKRLNLLATWKGTVSIRE